MVLSEYPKESPSNSGIPISLELESVQSNYIIGEALIAMSVSPIMESKPETINCKFKSDGYLLEDDEKFVITYDEVPDTELGKCTTELIFFKNEPKSVYITRKGDVSTSFCITESVQTGGIYKTNFGVMELSTNGIKVSFDFKGNLGLIKLDYVIEIRGCDAQRTKMKIKLHK